MGVLVTLQTPVRHNEEEKEIFIPDVIENIISYRKGRFVGEVSLIFYR